MVAVPFPVQLGGVVVTPGSGGLTPVAGALLKDVLGEEAQAPVPATTV
jgi:hypothetical protein